MSIAERAAAAHRLLQKRTIELPISPYTAADITRAAGRLAALLGIDPAQVRPRDNWNHITLPVVPLTLYASDPDDPGTQYTFSYGDPLYDDEPFLLMGPCPVCDAAVPLAEVRSLADLGAFLTTGPEPLPENHVLPSSYPDEFDQHPAHTSQCPYREGDC
ncbi:hypothetical protein AB0I98_35515 [Streptomyces sp. NPDC050211]|uniref:hypothetical protein n=1 Tax=Streptomyces sp. NPDC050211 TaxID=3154932 RepID=UPI0034410EBC